MRIYYAHCIALYNTPQEERDMETLRKMFPKAEIYNPNNAECSKGYSEQGMDFFEEIIKKCDIVAFRALPDGKIPAGVWKEIQWGQYYCNNIIELPGLVGRAMSVDDTRQYIKEVGYR